MSDSLFPDAPISSQGLALARKWRPRDFNTLVGQDHVVKALTHALDQQRLHHAWLFTGTRGVGKTTISRILAKSLNCTGPDGQEINQPTSQPCGQCQACREIDAGRFVDYIEMDAASNRGVDEMASLLEKAIYAPTNARYKVYMIDEVHMLTSHAFNSMLKTLEEPPPHVKFILATTDPQKIPVTVLSRCLQFNLKQMPPSLIVSHLGDILNKESVAYQDNALRILAKAAQGSMRDALSLTDQAIAYAAGEITEDSVRSMLGTLDDSYLIRILEALNQRDGATLVATSQEMGASSMSFSLALQDLASLLQKISMAQVIPGSVLEEWPEAESVKRLSQLFSKEEIQLYYQIAITSRPDLSLAPDEESGFMMALLRMLAFKPDNGGTSMLGSVNSPAVANPGKVNSNSKAAPKPQIATPNLKVENESKPIEQKISEQSLGRIDAPIDWQQLIKTFPLRGLSQQFAYQTELKSWQDMGSSIQILVVTAMPQIATEDAINRLTGFLEGHFNKPVKLKVEGGDAVQTVAVAQAKEKQALQASAEKEIATDPFVKALQNEIGVKVISGSERPA